jgi:hypothetical protein
MLTISIFSLLIISVYCQTNRTFLIKKDLISGLKGGEFTIYDPTGKTRLYRMESKVGVTHHVKLFEGNEKKSPLAELKGKVTAVMYKAAISVLNKNVNKWSNGTIEQNFKIVGKKFLINFNGNDISMEGKGASLDTTFIDQSNQFVLAKFRKRLTSLFWRNKYDLQIFSDKYPDQIYFLGVAARDHSSKKIQRG